MMRKDLNEKLVGVKKAAGVEHQRIRRSSPPSTPTT